VSESLRPTTWWQKRRRIVDTKTNDLGSWLASFRPDLARLLKERYCIAAEPSRSTALKNHPNGVNGSSRKRVIADPAASSFPANGNWPESAGDRLTCWEGLGRLQNSDLSQLVDDLRFERYQASSLKVGIVSDLRRTQLLIYYWLLRPFLGPRLRKHLQRLYLRGWEKLPFPSWPVDTTVDSIFEHLLVLVMKAYHCESLPFIWFWPKEYLSCAIITHDVETASGFKNCGRLMDLDRSFGFKASFQLVPEERYASSRADVSRIWERGFEVNVHDLNHDGLLFSSHSTFRKRVQRINEYGRRFGASGFRAGGLYRNADWYDSLEFLYDMSIPNVAHLEPQRGGCCTVFPFFIGDIVELPVTTTQDYTLFHILTQKSIEIWRRQISLIRQKHGLMSFIIHPDYLATANARRMYMELLKHLSDLRSEGSVWTPLPYEVASWWRLRRKLRIVFEGGAPRIEGDGSGQATLAYAALRDGRLEYTLEQDSRYAGQESRT